MSREAEDRPSVVPARRVTGAPRRIEPPWQRLTAESPLQTAIVDSDGRITYQNRTVRGLLISDMTGRHFSDFVEPEFRGVVRTAINRVFAEDATPTWEARGVGHDGALAWYQCWAVPLREHGEVVAAVIHTADVTARKVMEEQAERLEHHFEDAERLAGLGSWEWRLATNEVIWSDELYRIYGLRPRQFKATLEGFLGRIRKDRRESMKATVLRAVSDRGRFEVYEWIVRPNGEERILHSVGEMIERGADDWIMLGVCLDITERHRLEQELLKKEAGLRELTEELDKRVAQRTRQLSALNEELEALTFSVAHDLRAPLRSIEGFGAALSEDFTTRLDDVGRDYVTRIRRATRTMSERIDEILKLSRVGRADIALSRVDLAALARDVAEDLESTDPARDVTFVIPDELVVRGDTLLLRTVVENLLGNAWKFTAKHPSARIEIGTTDTARGPAYFVRDDGAGFDPQYAFKLFAPFQRLHTHDEFEGTGVGLASVRRIVLRHGGETWAEGAIDKGATIFFTLPG